MSDLIAIQRIEGWEKWKTNVSAATSDRRSPQPSRTAKIEVMTLKRTRGYMSLFCLSVLFASCAKPRPPIEDLHGRENLSAFVLGELRGTRDGDRLDAEVRFGDGSSTLVATLHFAIGAPTTLKSGRWEWMRGEDLQNGTIAGRSVMFLGGQDGPPSIGGTFDLLDHSGVAEYRITIPTSELKVKFPGQINR